MKKIDKDNVSVTAKVPDKEFIQTISSCILSNPRFVLNSTLQEKLFSENQMYEMFCLGYETRRREIYYRRSVNIKNREAPPIYLLLRNMNVGDTITFPHKSWNSVRSAASTIKKEFGSIYSVSKLGKKNEKGDIEVIRTA